MYCLTLKHIQRQILTTNMFKQINEPNKLDRLIQSIEKDEKKKCCWTSELATNLVKKI